MTTDTRESAKVAIMTGAGHPDGIGAASAKALRDQGYEVITFDLEGADHAVDVTDAQQVAKAMQLAGDDADCIDALAAQWLGRAEGKFDALPVTVQRQVVQRQLFGLAVEPSFDLVEALRIRLGQAIEIAPGKRLQRTDSGVIDWAPTTVEQIFSVARSEVELLGQAGEAEFSGCSISWERISGGLAKWNELGQADNREVFDAAALGQAVSYTHLTLPTKRIV